MNSHAFPEYFKKLLRNEIQTDSPKLVTKFLIKDWSEMNRTTDSKINDNRWLQFLFLNLIIVYINLK